MAIALVGVALAATAVFASLTLIIERADVGHLAATQHAETVAAVASLLDNAYRADGTWTLDDLRPAATLGDIQGADLELDRLDGTVLFRSGSGTLLKATDTPHVRRTLQIGSQRIAVLRLAFPAGGLSPAERRLRSALAEALAVSAGLAVLGAAVVAGIATRVLVRPIHRLTAAARALEAGGSIRLGSRAGPGEFGELGRAFDSMAATLERNEQLRRTMAADVAHELRTPLAILQAETESLVEGVREPTAGALASLHEETLRLGHMVEDLQTLASAEAAGLSLDPHPIDLATVAAEAAESLAGRFRVASVGLERSLYPAVVWADPHRIRQVAVNLLANAVKFTPPGGRVTLVVRASNLTARLEVTDTGPGVPADEHHQIFERFFRGSAGRKRGGTGIGLAVVRELVEANGGSIELQSPSGGGARFVVCLPLATDRESTA